MSFSARGTAAWLPLLVVLSLQACGGGGGGGEAPSNPPVTGPPPPPAPAASSYASPQSYTVGTAITPVKKIYLVYYVGGGRGTWPLTPYDTVRARVAPSRFLVET
jgi:hypothetical protein